MTSEDEFDAVQLLDYAYYYLTRGEFEEAHDLALEARELFEELRNESGSAESRWVLGLVQYEMGEFKAALPLLASAQQQFAMLGQIRQHCATLYILARCHLGLERPNMAIYALKLARSAIETKRDPFSSSNDRRNPFLPDWDLLIEMINILLDQLLAENQHLK